MLIKIEVLDSVFLLFFLFKIGDLAFLAFPRESH